MLKIFAMNNTPFNDGETFEKALALVDETRGEKVRALAVREKKNASLSAGVILPLALKACGVGGEVKVEYGQWEKPRLIKPEGWHFNLSHSGEWTVLALSDKEVGVDIQQAKPVDMRLATRFFTESEQAEIGNAGENAQELFYRIWTIKEAYLKALGVGLNRPLNSFTVRFTAGGAKIDDPSVNEEWLVSELGDFAGYKLAVCGKEYAPDEPPEILEI